jgi:hypothetical protein
MIGHSNRRSVGHKEAAIDAAMKTPLADPPRTGASVKPRTKLVSALAAMPRAHRFGKH